ncbi:MAG: hypothetical protein HQM04_16005 [Magnetococcales bacterium]|nr:hypothetical protein [Magnetococcales bacterium]MBF0116531.1 hypothetical protein [Magnetococcales bacterium]
MAQSENLEGQQQQAAPPPSPPKKKCPTCKKGTPLWFISWADMVTLLFCLFVIIVAYSSQDKGKFQTVAGSMREAFGGNDPQTNPRPVPRGYHMIGMTFQRHIQLANIADQVRVLISPLLNDGQANAFEDPAGVVFQIDRDALFQPGTTAPTAAAQLMLADIASVVRNVPNLLEIRSSPAPVYDRPYNWSAGKQETAAIAHLFNQQGGIANNRLRVTTISALDKAGSAVVAGKKAAKDKIEIRLVANLEQ